MAECNVILDPSSESTTKNWIMKSLEDEKLTGRTLKTVAKLYSGIQYGTYGSWNKEEVVKAVLVLLQACIRQVVFFF